MVKNSHTVTGVSIVLVFISSLDAARQWNGGVEVTWSSNCDIYGGDNVRNQSSPGNECASLCYDDENCTHFTYEEGTCMLKSRKVVRPNEFKDTAIFKPHSVCGFLDISWSSQKLLPGVNWAYNCVFPGNDFKEIPIAGEHCGGLCESHSQCGHFSWKKINRTGICYLKTGNVSRGDEQYEPRTVCGIIKRSQLGPQPAVAHSINNAGPPRASTRPSVVSSSTQSSTPTEECFCDCD